MLHRHARKIARHLTLTATIALGSLAIHGCHDDDDEKLAKYEAQVAKTRTVMANQCSNDSDCLVTGCHGTMCRAMPEPDFCDHRIVLAIDDPTDIPVIKKFVADQLTLSESESIRIGGYSAGLWTLSFQASQAQRLRVEQALQGLNHSGFAKLHPKANLHTQTAFEALSPKDRDMTLKTMKGAGKLIEKLIRAGDILSKEDIRNAWTQLSDIKNIRISDDDDIERFWAYDVIFDKQPALRLWPVDKRQRISVRLWKSISTRVDNGDLIVSAKLDDTVVDTFRQWTEKGEIILLIVGNEVVAPAIPQKNIEDGQFELVIDNHTQNETLNDAVDALKSIAQMKGTVRIDNKATASVERDITCHNQFPRECACIEGFCGWKINPDYNACLYE